MIRAWWFIAWAALLLLAQSLCVRDAHGQIAEFADPEPVKRELSVYWSDKPPVIDGDLSDAIWQRLPRVTGLVDITFRHDYVLNQTLFSVAYDKDNLYIAVDCRDHTPAAVKGTVTDRDGNLWEAGDDTIELFFDLDGAGKHCIQIATNPAAARWDFRSDKSSGRRAEWDGKWDVACERTDTGWTAEFAFPFANLEGNPPQPGTKLKANIARTRRPEGDESHSSWSIIDVSFHNLKQYGHWVFAPADTPVKREDELTINRHFMETERQSLRGLLRRSGHEIELAKAAAAGAPETSALDPVPEIERHRVALESRIHESSQLDSILILRSVGRQLSVHLKDLAQRLSLAGLAGPLDVWSLKHKGARRVGNYYVFVGVRGIFAVAAESGALAGAWDRRNRHRVIAASYDLYSLDSRNGQIRSDERFDVGSVIYHSDNSLIVACINPELKDVRIVKQYSLLNGSDILSKRVSVAGPSGEDVLIGITSNTTFDPQYRESSLYNRMMSAGAAGGSDVRATIPAKQITADIIQRGGNNKACGWAQFVLANTETRSGIAQYLYRLNDQYVWVPYSMPSSYWNASGWELSVLGTFLKQEPSSAETRYHLFDGDQVNFYQDYLQLPEVVAARSELPVHPVVGKLKGFGIGADISAVFAPEFPDGINPRINEAYRRLRSDEYNLGWEVPRHSLYSTWPLADDDEFVWINPNTQSKSQANAGKARRLLQRLKEQCPRHLFSTYWVHTDIHPDTAAYHEHPEFAIVRKDGSPTLATHPYGAFEADMSDAFVDYVVPKYEAMVQAFGLDYLYFDYFGGSAEADWQQGRVMQSSDYMRFDRSIRRMLAAHDGFSFFNGNPGQLYVDINFAESIGSDSAMNKMGTDWWRWHHERLMYYKLMERPNMITVLLMWLNYRDGPQRGEDNNREYTNLILAMGLRPYACYYDYEVELKQENGSIDWARKHNYEEPYQQAALEMHGTQLADVDQEPRYWTDPESRVEAYVLRKGEAYFFTVLNHLATPVDIQVSADRGKLGFEPGKRMFRWDYARRDDSAVPRRIGPETDGWDRLFIETRCTSELLKAADRLEVAFSATDVNLTDVATVTQVPGVFLSKEGGEMQFKLPDVLGCSLLGDVDENERQVRLNASAPSPATVAAWWPKNWPAAQVRVNETSLSNLEYREFGEERFVLVPILAGQSRIVVSPQVR